MTKKQRVIQWLSILLCITIIITTTTSVLSFFTNGGEGNMEGIGSTCFRYFTIDSNILMAISCLFWIPYLLFTFNDRKKISMWIRLLLLSGTVSVTVTFVTVMVFLGPVLGYQAMLTGNNLFLHLINPLLALLLLLIAPDIKLSWKFFPIGVVPVFIYGVIYLIMVKFKEIWPDFYMIAQGNNLLFTIPVFLIGAAVITFGLILLQKKTAKAIFNQKPVKPDNAYFLKDLSAYDIYIRRIFKSVVLLATSAAICAGTVFTVEKAMGWLPDVSWPGLIVFDISCVFYLVLSIVYMNASTTEDGFVIPSRFRIGKVFYAILICVQWNFISYLIPLTDFWAYAAFFILLSVFFFDTKLVDCLIAELTISIAVSWIIKGPELISPEGNAFEANMIIRVVCIVLTMATLHLITHFGERFLMYELEKYSNCDVLTGLYNRHKLNHMLLDAFGKAKKRKSGMTLALIDLDHFKQVNDTYGHECGDAVLVHIAKFLTEHAAPPCEIFRWGGEEILILYHCDLDLALLNMSNIQKELQDCPTEFNGEKIPVTFTCGISSYPEKNTISDLMELADSRLYAGKNQGRNVIIYE